MRQEKRETLREVDAASRSAIKNRVTPVSPEEPLLPSCTLEIGGRIVARAEGGPFDAEYSLFEAHEIELRSNNEPGTVREHGYQTTAELARERLEMDGVTRALAEATAAELGALATAYARGPEVRRVVTLLGACELFEGRVWQPATKKYEGAWLDVSALAADSGARRRGEGAPAPLPRGAPLRGGARIARVPEHHGLHRGPAARRENAPACLPRVGRRDARGHPRARRSTHGAPPRDGGRRAGSSWRACAGD